MRHRLVLALAAVAACSSPSPTAMTPVTPTAPTTPTPPVTTPPATAPAQPPEDPYLWLEDVDAARSLDWARAQNKVSEAELTAVPGFDAMRTRLKTIFDSKAKIPYVGKRGAYLYNLWQDDAHPRGQWRRTTLAEYRKAQPKWDVILDIDALNTTESATWVWKGAQCLYPKYERCLVSLSRGGADATVVRELDVPTRKFVADGFVLPEAKSDIVWRDLDSVYVGTDFGPGSLTTAGYPRIAKLWKRGTPLASATTVFEGKPGDVADVAIRSHEHGRTHDYVYARTSTFTSVAYPIDAKGVASSVKVDKPDDANLDFWDDEVVITLRTPWTTGGTTYPAGAALIEPERDFAAGKRAFQLLYTPKPNTSLAGIAGGKTQIYVTELEDVHDLLYRWHRDAKGTWTRTQVATPPLASFDVTGWDEEDNDDYWMTDSSFLSPATFALVHAGKKEILKRSPEFFDTKGLAVEQHFVTSKDGTRVPYFQIARANLALDGSAPTLIEGYGGFEISETPGYFAVSGSAWLERGGVYVVPNLRGGGEYGPAWHTQATKHGRQKIYDDFAAIAEDLIARKVTQPAKLAIKGGSNGGLLVGVMMTERPELFGAVVCSAPLLDMKRYHKLLAGASWMEEYGDPDNADDWAAIAKYSPYQNVHAGTQYPRVLFTTSTRDDRVHPGHARKMAARMLEQKHPLLFYENIEGGHAGAADNGQYAYLATLEYAFLWKQLGLAR